MQNDETQNACFFREFQYDPLAMPDGDWNEFHYDRECADAYFDKHKEQGKRHFAIMLGDLVIGDIYLKHIDVGQKCCTIGIHIINDTYKGNGYGTQALLQILHYTFKELKMEQVFADVQNKNTRSQRVLEKVGFTAIGKDEEKTYYECRKSSWLLDNKVKTGHKSSW